MTEETALSTESPPVAVPPNPEVPEADAEVTEGTAPQAAEPEPKKDDEEQEFTRTQRNWKALREDRDHWRDMAREVLQRTAQPETRKPDPVERPEPVPKVKTLADFEYDESKYQSYLFAEATRAAKEVAKEELRTEREQHAAQRRFTEFKSKEAKFSASVEDYAEVAHRAPINDDVAQVVMELDEAPAVAYFLGKNPDVAHRLNDLPAHRVGIELGKIEERLAREKEKAKEKPAVSKAPPPTPKIEAAGDATPKVRADDPESDKLDIDAWRKQREKDLARKRK